MKKIALGFIAVCAIVVAAWEGFAYVNQNQAPVAPVTPAPSGTGTVPVPGKGTGAVQTTPTPNPTPVTPPPVPTTPPTTTPAPAPKPVTSTFKDGTYTAQGSYFSPAGQDEIGITLTLKNDVIVNATGQVLATNHASNRYQQVFVSNFSSLVVGKKITEVTLSNVSGASLTPQGFNDAVTQIEAQAKA